MNNANNNLKNNGTIIAGAIVVLIGVIFLLNQLNILDALNLRRIFNFKVLLIAYGIYSGARRNFAQPYSWTLPILVGVIFLIGDITGVHLTHYIIPILLIGAGSIMIINATSGSKWLQLYKKNNPNIVDADYVDMENPASNSSNEANNTSNNTVQLNSIFSGTKQIVTHKNFRGGTVNAILGGAEINLMQADMKSPAILDVMIIMGGLKLIVPTGWSVKQEVVSMFGGIEDNRPQILSDAETDTKLLIIKGTAIMGGVDVRSY